MITSIQGTLASATPLRAVVEVGGLGYEVHVPVTTAEKLPVPGKPVKLHTHVVYREDNHTLYGFHAEAERDFFRLMIEQVTGVGPKVALTILSKLSLPVLESAIRAGDIATLAQCPGIGRKTAERLVVELKSKVGATADSGIAAAVAGAPSAHADAVAALAALGYKPADAEQAVRRAALAIGGEPTTEALVKRALN